MHELTFRHASALHPHTRVSTLSSSSNSRQLTSAWDRTIMRGFNLNPFWITKH